MKFYKKANKYWASIRCNGKYYHCGEFQTEKEACRARNQKAKELYGENANLHNISDDEE